MRHHLATAEAAARAGGAVLVRREGDLGRVRSKVTAVDLVTEADIESGVAVCRAVAERLEDARFVVEEPEVYDLAGVTPGTLDDEEVWVVDPLDGTTSFVHGFPCYSVSVALLRSGLPVAGAVLDVPTGELYAALKGEGATCKGVPLRCTDEESLDRALLISGFPYDRGRTLQRQLAVLTRVMQHAHGLRRDGSAALDLCRVARGQADGFWEFGLKPWDTAAGTLVASEAGVVVTDLEGRPWTTVTEHVVAANPRLQPVLRELVAGADPGT